MQPLPVARLLGDHNTGSGKTLSRSVYWTTSTIVRHKTPSSSSNSIAPQLLKVFTALKSPANFRHCWALPLAWSVAGAWQLSFRFPFDVLALATSIPLSYRTTLPPQVSATLSCWSKFRLELDFFLSFQQSLRYSCPRGCG
jgi:hypothetical protein